MLQEAKVVQASKFDSTVRVFVSIMDWSQGKLSKTASRELLKYEECALGHIQTTHHSSSQSIVLPIISQSFPDETRPITSIVQAYLLSSNHTATIKNDSQMCTSEESCTAPSVRMQITTKLPEVLIVEEQQALPSIEQVRFEFPAELTVKLEVRSETIKYTLVGRLEFSSNHYTALL